MGIDWICILRELFISCATGLISNEGQAPDRTYIIAYDMHDRILTHGNAKSLGEKLSARQYQSIHKYDKISVHTSGRCFYT